jgi:hypothetical protein
MADAAVTFPVPSGELSQLRAASLVTLGDTCTLERITQANDSGGGYSDTVVTATVACSVAPGPDMSALEQLAGGVVAPSVPFVVRLPHDTVIDANDRILHSGRTLEVIAVLGPRTNELVRRVLCRQVMGG